MDPAYYQNIILDGRTSNRMLNDSYYLTTLKKGSGTNIKGLTDGLWDHIRKKKKKKKKNPRFQAIIIVNRF